MKSRLAYHVLGIAIALAVSMNIRQMIRSLRIRPEVRRQAHVVMLVAARRHCILLHDGEWTCAHGFVGFGARSLPYIALLVRMSLSKLALVLKDFGIQQEDSRGFCIGYDLVS